MARSLKLRAPTDEERRELERLTHARTAPARLVERARVVWAALQGERAEAIAARFHVTAATVYLWLHRYTDSGVAGLEDRPRKGRPPTYSREQVATIIAAALTAPRQLDQPFASWTLDRLVTYLHEQHSITMQRSRLDELLLAEGLRWRKQESWFGERVDPEFAAKRGR
jgi:transposase